MATVIEGKNAVLGRLASVIAERAMKNEDIVIVNAEKVIVNGTREGVMERYLRREGLRAKGNALKGPKFYSKPEALVRSAVKGMLPQKTTRGRKAIKRVQVYAGIPKEFAEQKIETIEDVLQGRKRVYLRIAQVSELLRGKR